MRQQFFTTKPTDYTEIKDVKLLVGTYNVAGKRPPTGLQLTDWLGSGDGADIVAVGFQEVVALNAQNVLAGVANDGMQAWDYAIASALNGEDWASCYVGKVFNTNSATLLGAPGSSVGMAYETLTTGLVDAMDRMWITGAINHEGLIRHNSATMWTNAPVDDLEDKVYVQIVSKQLVGVYLTVWVKRSFLPHIRGVQSTNVATGFGGYLGNKGAVAVRMLVYDSQLCLICSHLASGDQEGDELKRNADYADILRRCVFNSGGDQDPSFAEARGPPAGRGLWGDARQLSDHMNCIWLGDLNYRINLPDEEARLLIKANKLEKLREYDQLTREMAQGRVFQGWKEFPLTFPPTYKYHLGSYKYSGEALGPGAGSVEGDDDDDNEVDSRSPSRTSRSSPMAKVRPGNNRDFSPLTNHLTSRPGSFTTGNSRSTTPTKEVCESDSSFTGSVKVAKRRTPAWCDRILYVPGRELHQLAYSRSELTVSDHRPVCAGFNLRAHHYLKDRVDNLLENIRRDVDISEMATRPKCTVDPHFIDIGTLKFGQRQQFKVTLQNVGAVDADYHFIAPPQPRNPGSRKISWDDSLPVCPPWLRISPQESMVLATLAKGSSQELSLEVLVVGGPLGAAEELSLTALEASSSSSSRKLDCILILRVEDGSDMYVSVSGTYIPSCFGQPFSALLQSQSGGRSVIKASGGVDTGDLLHLENGDGEVEESSCSCPPGIPHVLYRLTHYLCQESHMKTPGLFLESYSAVCPPSASLTDLEILQATAQVREALDSRAPFPPGTTPHHVAATLMAMFRQLPESFMPQPVVNLCNRCVVSGNHAAQLCADAMAPDDFTALRLVLGLCHQLLRPDVQAANGLDKEILASVLAECWFPQAQIVSIDGRENRGNFVGSLIDHLGGESPVAPLASEVAVSLL